MQVPEGLNDLLALNCLQAMLFCCKQRKYMKDDEPFNTCIDC